MITSLRSCIGETSEKRRISGLDRPWHPLQVLTWLLFIILMLLYFCFLMPMLWTQNYAKEVLTAVFCALSLAALVAAYFTCSIDPIDEALAGAAIPTDEPHLYCYICETNVHESSKHCRYCDKCVLRFDHHCKWYSRLPPPVSALPLMPI